MKKFLPLTLAAAALLTAMTSASAESFESDGFRFTVTDSRNADVSFDGLVSGSDATSIDIPQSVSYQGTDYEVTSLANGAFINNTMLETVSIPSGIQAIPDSLFLGCTSLVQVTVPSSLESLGTGSFVGCTSLTELDLGNTGITALGSASGTKVTYIFWDENHRDPALETIVLPESLEVIGNYTFYYCPLTDVSLPWTLTTIGASAFSAPEATDPCLGQDTLIIPGSVTRIAYQAFEHCNIQKLIILPAATKSTTPTLTIEGLAFWREGSMAEVWCTQDVPPTMKDNSFYTTQYSAPLYVESEADIPEYQAAAGWKNFTEIHARAIATGIESVDTAPDAPHLTDVYTMTGLRVRDNVDAATATDGLPSGLYIVNGHKIQL